MVSLAPRTSSRATRPDRPRRAAIARRLAVAAAVLFAGLAAFQLALAVGVPWGEAAFGGSSPVLSVEFRIAAAVAVIVWSAAALVILRRAGHRVWAPLPDRALPVAVWVIAAYTALGVLVNSISPSLLERTIWVPVTIAMAALSFGVAGLLRRAGIPVSPGRSNATSGSSA